MNLPSDTRQLLSYFQEHCATRLEEVLCRHGIACAPFTFEDEEDPWVWSGFEIDGTPYELQITEDMVVMWGGSGHEQLFEPYLPREFKTDRTLVESFAARFDRFLGGGDWAGTEELGVLDALKAKLKQAPAPVRLPSAQVTYFQEHCMMRLTAVLRRYDIRFSDFAVGANSENWFRSDFVWGGVPYTLQLYSSMVVMFGGERGEQIFEPYLDEEFTTDRAQVEGFAARLDRFLAGGSWAGPGESRRRLGLLAKLSRLVRRLRKSR
jgi:hypothetical protein